MPLALLPAVFQVGSPLLLHPPARQRRRAAARQQAAACVRPRRPRSHRSTQRPISRRTACRPKSRVLTSTPGARRGCTGAPCCGRPKAGLATAAVPCSTASPRPCRNWWASETHWKGGGAQLPPALPPDGWPPKDNTHVCANYDPFLRGGLPIDNRPGERPPACRLVRAGRRLGLVRPPSLSHSRRRRSRMQGTTPAGDRPARGGCRLPSPLPLPRPQPAPRSTRRIRSMMIPAPARPPSLAEARWPAARARRPPKSRRPPHRRPAPATTWSSSSWCTPTAPCSPASRKR
jgi:hypothetical protein